jgi:hypothetical protein
MLLSNSGRTRNEHFIGWQRSQVDIFRALSMLPPAVVTDFE